MDWLELGKNGYFKKMLSSAFAHLMILSGA
jgi:hypothetical protein